MEVDEDEFITEVERLERFVEQQYADKSTGYILTMLAALSVRYIVTNTSDLTKSQKVAQKHIDNFLKFLSTSALHKRSLN